MQTPKLKTIVLGAAIAAVFTFAGLALAQGPGGGPGKGPGRGPGAGAWCDQEGPGRGIERLAARLDLNEDQVKAITALQDGSRAKNQALRKDLLRLRNELEGELLKDQPDVKAVKNLAAKIGDLRTQMQQNRLETRLAVRQQLTPEQRDKMLLMGESGRGHRVGRHGMRGDRDGFGRGDFGRGPGRGQGRGPGLNPDCPNADR